MLARCSRVSAAKSAANSGSCASEFDGGAGAAASWTNAASSRPRPSSIARQLSALPPPVSASSASAPARRANDSLPALRAQSRMPASSAAHSPFSLAPDSGSRSTQRFASSSIRSRSSTPPPFCWPALMPSGLRVLHVSRIAYRSLGISFRVLVRERTGSPEPDERTQSGPLDVAGGLLREPLQQGNPGSVSRLPHHPCRHRHPRGIGRRGHLPQRLRRDPVFQKEKTVQRITRHPRGLVLHRFAKEMPGSGQIESPKSLNGVGPHAHVLFPQEPVHPFRLTDPAGD